MKIFRSLKHLLTTDLAELVSNAFLGRSSKDYIRLSINFFIAQVALSILGSSIYFLGSLFFPVASVLGQIGFLLLAYGVVLKVIDYFNQTALKDSMKPKEYPESIEPYIKATREVLKLNDTVQEESIELKVIEREEEITNRILRNYYTQVLNQSGISFTYSLVFAAIGFVVIIFSIVPQDLQFTNRNINQPNVNSSDNTSRLEERQNYKWASLISGIVIEAVSALIFVQTNNARKTMIEFSEKIRLDRRLNESLSLIDTIPNEKIQSRVKALLVLNFSGIVMKYDDQEILQQVINTRKDEDEWFYER